MEFLRTIKQNKIKTYCRRLGAISLFLEQFKRAGRKRRGGPTK